MTYAVPPQTPFRSAHSWHSLWSQYSQPGVAVQLALGDSLQNAGEQSLLLGVLQSDGKGTLKV